jgi:hypothetical protein
MSKKQNPIPGNKPFQKGQSGNPNGRPKLRDIKEVISDLLSQEKNKQQLIDGLMTVIVNKALKGDLKAAEMLLSYTYGKPTQKTEIVAEVETTVKDINLKKLNLDELRNLERIAEKLENDKGGDSK